MTSTSNKHCIATIGSHSALQILKGARDEGFKTICICLKGREKVYKEFEVADKIIVIDKYENFFSIEAKLMNENAILIPHASMIAHFGIKNILKIKMNYFGDKNILKVESNRKDQNLWLKNSGLNTPRQFNRSQKIDRLSIVKLHGAKGGQGYFLVNSRSDLKQKLKHKSDYIIQEYVVGVPVYIHYFYSELDKKIEVMSLDRRYESNVDGIGRIKAKDQIQAVIESSYTVVGNSGLVLRESLLPEVFEMGENVVKQSKKLTKKGVFGPFCLETIVTADLKFYVFEISARIVAGTNLYTNGSPYTWLKYDEPMSTGRRIAREIKKAIKLNKLHKVLG